MKIAVADLYPNPFRDLKRYPTTPEKVATLKQSIKDTSFWDNLLARKGQNGGYELAYGHNRRQALKEAGIKEIDIPIRDLDDDTMAKIMVRENMEEWDNSAEVAQESVRAVVTAYAEGRVHLPKLKGEEKHIRLAPSFKPTGGKAAVDGGFPYTVETLGEFLGWPEHRVRAALSALAAIEEDLATDEDFKDLTPYQADAVAKESRRVAKETEDPALARAVSKKLAEGMRATVGKSRSATRQEVTVHTARQKADELIPPSKRKIPPSTHVKKLPPLDKFTEELIVKLRDSWQPESPLGQKLEAVYKHREHLQIGQRRSLVSALKGLIKRVEKYAAGLEG